MFFFAACAIAGLAVLVLTITGSLKDGPVVGFAGGVAALLSIYVLVKGRAYIRSGRGTEDSEL